MAKAIRYIALFLATLQLAACTVSEIKTDETVVGADLNRAGIVVVGLKSSILGPVGSGYWVTQSEWKTLTPDSRGALSRDWFPFARKADLTSRFAVMRIPISSKNTYIGPTSFYGDGISFTYCGGRLLPAVKLEAGEVVYMGDIEVITKGKSVFFEYGYNLDAAKKYMKEYYPEISDVLEGRQFKMRKVAGNSLVCL